MRFALVPVLKCHLEVSALHSICEVIYDVSITILAFVRGHLEPFDVKISLGWSIFRLLARFPMM